MLNDFARPDEHCSVHEHLGDLGQPLGESVSKKIDQIAGQSISFLVSRHCWYCFWIISSLRFQAVTRRLQLFIQEPALRLNLRTICCATRPVNRWLRSMFSSNNSKNYGAVPVRRKPSSSGATGGA